MNSSVAFGSALWGITGTLFAAIVVRSLRDFSWHDLTEYCRSRHYENRLRAIRNEEERVLLGMETLQLLSLLAAILGASHWWNQVAPTAPWPTMLGWLLAGGFVMLAAAVWIPQAISTWWGEALLAETWPVCSAVGKTLQPLAAVASVLTLLAGRLQGAHIAKEPTQQEKEKILEDEIRSIVSEGVHDGLFQSEAVSMLEGVMELDDNCVNSIMTPRSQVDTLDTSMTWDEMLAEVISCRRTRIPVIDSNDVDDFVGVLYVKDLLPELAKADRADRVSWLALVRDVRQVPASQPVDELLHDFLGERSHLGLVRDEFGNMLGLVTIEDVLEEIVGEITDESDRELDETRQPDLVELSDTAIEVAGTLPVPDLNEHLGTELPEGLDFDTMAGFVLRHLGRIPTVGESFPWQGYRITVVSASPRSVDRLRIDVNGHPEKAS